MPAYERVCLKVLKYWRVGLADYRRKQLKYIDFTIASNNCWGGIIYESYNLPKGSPAVGMFFMAEDCIKFLTNLKDCFATELSFIRSGDFKWKDAPQVSEDKLFSTYPIGG